MGSTHPPLESLLTFSQNCLEGFEHSRLNRISNLRKEFREIVEEWIEFEIEARLARWILEGRQAPGAQSVLNQAAAGELVSPELALRRLADDAGEIVPPLRDVLAPEFSYGSMLELHDGVALELKLPFRRVPVSQDAAAALRSLEHFARSKARSIGARPIELLDYSAPCADLPCPLLPFPESDAMDVSGSVVLRISHAVSGAIRPDRYIVRHSSAVLTSAPTSSHAPLGVNLLPRLHRRAEKSVGRYSFVVATGRTHLPRLPPVRVSLRQSSLRHAAALLRN
jgi:hypothetical protein